LGPALRFRTLLVALVMWALAAHAPSVRASEDYDGYDHTRDESGHPGTSVELLTFGGGTNGIYVKRHLSPRNAVRIGADFYLSSNKFSIPPEGTVTQNGASSTRSYTVSAELERFIDATGPVTVFLGLGPYYGHWRGRNERYRTGYDGAGPILEHYEADGFQRIIGGSAAAGFDWYFKRSLSVTGRVGASAGFGRSHYRSRSTRTDSSGSVLYDFHDEYRSTTSTASTSSAALGIGVHF